jgi:hypothetical protein
MKKYTPWRMAVWLAVPAFGLGCDADDRTKTMPGTTQEAQADPEIGATEFVSAAAGGSATRGGMKDAAELGNSEPSAASPGSEQATVEEGDIYRVLDGGKILNLNAYRGLQVLDVSDPDAPAILGSLRLTGAPVELYVTGSKAVVLMNNWTGYYGGKSAALGMEAGGLVMLVDLSDPKAPMELDRQVIPGFIQRSRLRTQGDAVTVYAAAQMGAVYNYTGGDVAVSSEEKTVVSSLAVQGSQLTPMSELDLGGYASAIQATPDALLVARTTWGDDSPTSSVAVVDITNSDGTMKLGADVKVAGQVQTQFGMDLAGTVLRVVSRGLGSESLTNHLETFDVSDIAAPKGIDHDTFGDGQDLYATLFVGDRAFFVTYLRQDPFHAFEITADGTATEMSEFIVSGWNDFFKPAFEDARLLGIGVDDETATRKLAVSLYDITNLTNPEPLLARETVELEWGWSEASWDHRAFSVLEGAASAQAKDGTKETGLVLLPYSGWDQAGYLSGVQLFTFSPTTLTRRGSLQESSPVRRSFLVADGTAANLSDTELALHDVSNPDAPQAQGKLSLAANYSEVLLYGDYGARHMETTSWYWYGGKDAPDGEIQIIGLDGDPDLAKPVASFPVTQGASTTKVGNLLVAATQRWDGLANDGKGAQVADFAVWDLTDPAKPTQTGTLTGAEIGQGGYGFYGAASRAPAGDCFDCWGGWGGLTGTVVGHAIVFPEWKGESKAGGTRKDCSTYPAGSGPNTASEPPRALPASSGGSPGAAPTDPTDPGERDGQPAPTPDADPPSTYYTGGIYCASENGGEEICYGEIYLCSSSGECNPVDPTSIETTTTCNEYPFDIYWTRLVYHILDLTSPSVPKLQPPIETAKEQQGAATLAAGSTLWHSFALPFEVDGDAKTYVKYYAQPIGLSNPGAPDLGTPINVPGQLVAVDGETLYTQDFLWGEETLETAVARLTWKDGVATLQALERFKDRQVHALMLDGAGHVLVSHGPPYAYGGWGAPGVAVARSSASAAASTEPAPPPDKGDESSDPGVKLSILDGTSLVVLSETPVDSWASLAHAAAGRAIFTVNAGILVMNLDDPKAPWPQAYFPTQGWGSRLEVSGDRAFFAAGLFGLFGFDLDEANLAATAAP